MNQRPFRIVIAMALATALLLPSPAPVAHAAAGHPILYVDGKQGYDNAPTYEWSTDWGRSPAKPFKTIERALEETRHGSPTAIRIRGYDDYVYRETITRGYRTGTADTPVVISSYTNDELPGQALIRPTIDGGIEVGRDGWTRPWSGTYPNVWCKTWNPPSGNVVTGQKVPPGYDTQYDSTREDRLYLDGSQPLHRPSVTPSIAQLNRQPYSQYWDRTRSTNNLCVHLGRWDGQAIDPDPTRHSIVVPWYLGIVLAGGSSHVTIRDLQVQHTVMGIGISVSRDRSVGKAHHNQVINVDASYNYRMGFWTAGDHNTFDRITGSRNSIQLIKLDVGQYADGTWYGAQRNVIRSSVSDQNLAQGIKLYGRQVRYNQAYDNTLGGGGIPAVAKAGGGSTKAIQVSNGASNNAFWRNRITGVDSGIELYQYDTRGGPLSENAFHHNWIQDVGTGVFLWDRKVSSTFGTGVNRFSYNIYYDTQTAIGGNGTSRGKIFDHETIKRSGFRTGNTTPSVDRSGVNVMRGTITIRNSIIDETNGPSICPRAGATVKLSYTDVYRWRNDPRSSMPHGRFCRSTEQHRFGTVDVRSGVLWIDPLLVTDADSSAFLGLRPESLLHTKSSTGGPLGAR